MPGREPLTHDLAVVGCFEKVARWAKVGVYRFEDRQKALGVSGRLETLQRPFSSPSPLVRVLSSVIKVTALTMFGVGQQFFKRGAIAS